MMMAVIKISLNPLPLLHRWTSSFASNHQSVEGDRFELMMQHANLSNIYVRVEDGAEIPSEAQLFGEE